MGTRVLKIDRGAIDGALIEQAAGLLRKRGLVAFPTETVYGLGADALDAEAVVRIFEAKQRPLDDPLIVHIAAIQDLGRLSSGVPEAAGRLVEKFWPGPLTVVLRKSPAVPDIVTTGLETVAVRMPADPVALELIKAAGVPVAAPSANLFGRPSPTSASHVLEDLDGRVDMVLDGGRTDIGIESTVVEFVRDRVIVLRPGGVDLDDLRAVVPGVELSYGGGDKVRAPGQYPSHYSPRARVVLSELSAGQAARTREIAARHASSGKRTGILCVSEHAGGYDGFEVKVLGSARDPGQCAADLFHALREFDSEGIEVIVAEGIPEEGIGAAVMNRLRKAAD